jgi:hypothetical protein
VQTPQVTSCQEFHSTIGPSKSRMYLLNLGRANFARSPWSMTASRTCSQSGLMGASRPRTLAPPGEAADRMYSRVPGSSVLQAWKKCSTVGYHFGLSPSMVGSATKIGDPVKLEKAG